MKYKVLSPIKHGGRRHEIGAVVEMEPDQAGPLLASGCIAEEGAAAVRASATPETALDKPKADEPDRQARQEADKLRGRVRELEAELARRQRRPQAEAPSGAPNPEPAAEAKAGGAEAT